VLKGFHFDEATMNLMLGHFARVLIDVDLNSDLRDRILVERKEFVFYWNVEYEDFHCLAPLAIE
jgi:hypothetical protein